MSNIYLDFKDLTIMFVLLIFDQNKINYTGGKMGKFWIEKAMN